MTLLIWLVAASLVWGGALWVTGRLLQRPAGVSGAMRQWIWRGATALLAAPWIAAPVVMLFGLGLAPAEQVAVHTISIEPSAEMTAAMHALDAAALQTAAISNGRGMWSILSGASPGELILLSLALGWVFRFVMAQLALKRLLGIVNLSRPAEDGPAKAAVAVWVKRLKLRRAPRLRVVAEQHSPFSYGVLRPTICLPEGLEEKLARGSLDLVIGHECLHVARGDGWTRPVERVTADVLWFNPFAWLIRRELDVARELAVDEAVVAMSASRVAYARTLREVAGFAAGLPAMAPAASMSLAGGKNLMLRVSRTLGQAGRKPARAAILAAAMLGLVGAPLAVAQVMMAIPAPPAPVAPEAPRAPEAPPAAEFDPTDGAVRATFTAKVVKLSGDKATGYHVELQQTAPGETGQICLAKMDGLGSLEVDRDALVKRGEIVGHRSASGHVSFQVSCSGGLDGKGLQDFDITPPAPPSPPSPVDRPTRVAPPAPPPPPAPPGPVDPSTHVAPPAPPAPIAPPSPVTAPTPPAVPASLEGEAHAVLDGSARKTSAYGARVDPISGKLTFHSGVDLAATLGSSIHAPVAGRVTFAGVKEGRGNVVEMMAPNGIGVSFSQMDTMKVQSGDVVSAGMVLGTVGSSGRSTGPHLHLEVIADGQTQDPEKVKNLVLIGG